MIEWIHDLMDTLGLWSLPILLGAAVVEYLIPPFPGDTVTLFGAVLAVRGDIHWALVWLAVTCGTAFGVPIDWLVGRWLGARIDRLPTRHLKPWWHPLCRERVHHIQARYHRWGDWFILANRFIPAARGVFFIAAGASEIPLKRALLLGLVSAGVWNGLLIAGGFAVGENLEELERWMRTYNEAFKIGLGVALGVWLLWTLFKWLRPRRLV